MQPDLAIMALKRTPLRRVSKKRAKELAGYRLLKAWILRVKPFCECPSRNGAPTCMNHATELHHMRGRAGSNLCDERYLLPVCIECHAWIHSHTNEARKLGLMAF